MPESVQVIDPKTGKTLAETILHRLKILTILTVVIGALAMGTIVYVAVLQDRNTTALCAFKNDLEKRNQDAAKFLADHPEGAFGFTPAQIKQQIDNYARTIDALSSLHCPPLP